MELFYYSILLISDWDAFQVKSDEISLSTTENINQVKIKFIFVKTYNVYILLYILGELLVVTGLKLKKNYE